MSVNYVVKLKQIPFDIMSNANIMSYIRIYDCSSFPQKISREKLLVVDLHFLVEHVHFNCLWLMGIMSF